MTAAPFEVLTVCTGNVCRSPFAATLLRGELGRVAAGWPQVGTLTVRSAGTHALVGETMTEPMQALAKTVDAPDLLHVAQQLKPEMLESAGLVLALSRAHRSAIARMLPRASRTTFALVEFGRLLNELAQTAEFRLDVQANAADSMRSLVSAVATRRGFGTPPEDPSVDDVVDPYRRSKERYEESARQIAEAVDTITSSLSKMFHA